MLVPGLGSHGQDLLAAYHLDPALIPRPAQFAFENFRLGHGIGSGFVLPGQTVNVGIVEGGVPVAYTLLPDSGAVRPIDGRHWEWTAPATPGIVRLTAVDSLGIDSMRINVFVMTPYAELRKGILNGYRIGAYPVEREIGGVIYRRPRGFVEITEANRGTQLSPHFKLGQFECPQSSGYPRYAVLTEPLVAKLEAIVDGLGQFGHHVETLGIMSGYRSPWFNRSNGNAWYSRHQYGDAADFFVDADGDGRMDDLNEDGKVNGADARTLQCIIETLAVDARDDIVPGGLGTYRSSHVHGPFVHTDARGFRARWGLRAGCGGS